MKWGVATSVALILLLCLTTAGWGADSVSVSLVDLGDRDAVILRVDGEALVSDLVVHKLRPSRLEAFYRFDGESPSSIEVSGDLVKGVELSKRPDGFLLTLTLSNSIPASGETIYRETVLGSGQTALEVFSSSSKRGPFQISWLNEIVAPETKVSPANLSEPSGSPSLRVDGFSGATFDEKSLQLTLRGAAGQPFEVVNKTFPPRTDVVIPGSSLTPENSGKVFKDLKGKVTFVEIVAAKASEGIVVRANLTSGIGLLDQTTQGNDLVLTFGEVAKQIPAPRLTPSIQPAQAPNPAPAFRQSKPVPVASTPVTPLGTPISASTVGGSLSGIASAAMNAPTPMGFRGVPQDVPSVEQILSKSRDDAKRYSSNVAKRADIYGNYNLPSFPGAEKQLSDVRVNLNAAGGYGLRSFFTYLSLISGISIIIDPYWLDEPFGTTIREPPDPGQLPGGGAGGSGFRNAGVFDPSFGGTGTIEGNFDNVPFDQALDIVLNTHNLKKVVYRDDDDPYAKPIILITSKERLEQELKGQNEVDFYQLHYAEPFQIYAILEMLGMLPSLEYGWYEYYGGGGFGGGGSGGGGFGGGGSGGSGGSGGRGGGGRGGGGRRSASAPLDASSAAGGEMSSNYFGNIEPMQGGGGLGGGGGGQGGGGQGGGGQGGGGQGGGGGFGGGGGGQLWTAKAGLIVMRGTRQTLDAVQTLIAKIDKPPKQVALKVKLYTTSNNPQDIYGLISATAQDDRVDGDYSIGALSFNILPKGGVLLDENYSAAFSFLQSESKAHLVSETEIAVIDGFPASITTNRTRGQLDFQVTGTDINGLPIYVPTWTPISAGTTLTFTPQIDDRGRVTMNVNINISFFDGIAQRAAAPGGGEVIFQPTGNTTINTYFRMVDGQAALLGGLTNSEDSESFQGIPYLSKLPFIGRYLGRTEKVKASEHFFVVIQANIIDDK